MRSPKPSARRSEPRPKVTTRRRSRPCAGPCGCRRPASESCTPRLPTRSTTLASCATSSATRRGRVLYRRALGLARTTLPAEHPYIATSLENLSALYRPKAGRRSWPWWPIARFRGSGLPIRESADDAGVEAEASEAEVSEAGGLRRRGPVLRHRRPLRRRVACTQPSADNSRHDRQPARVARCADARDRVDIAAGRMVALWRKRRARG